MPPFVSLPEVAEMLGYTSPAAFRRCRDSLIEDHGFPEPMPTRKRSPIWRRDCVQDWIEDHGRARALPPAARPQGPNIILLELARSR